MRAAPPPAQDRTSTSPIGTTPVLAVPPPIGCSNFKLRQLTRRVTQLYDAELAKAGLKTTQYSLLSHVLKLGPLRPADLAQAMGMDASTLTRNLKPLLAQGWLNLNAGVDGRSRLVEITAAGRERRALAQRHWKTAQTSLNQRLGLPRVAALHTLMDDSLALLTSKRTTKHATKHATKRTADQTAARP